MNRAAKNANKIWHTIPSIERLHKVASAAEAEEKKLYYEAYDKGLPRPEYGNLIEKAVMGMEEFPLKVRQAYLKSCWYGDANPNGLGRAFQYPSRGVVAAMMFRI